MIATLLALVITFSGGAAVPTRPIVLPPMHCGVVRANGEHPCDVTVRHHRHHHYGHRHHEHHEEA